MGTNSGTDWSPCEAACNQAGNCNLWTFKYDGCGDYNGGVNCWLKSGAEWPGAFNYEGQQTAMPADPNVISGGSSILCYDPCGIQDRTDTCKDPEHDQTSPQCKSTHIGEYNKKEECADAAAKQGYAGFSYAYH